MAAFAGCNYGNTQGVSPYYNENTNNDLITNNPVSSPYNANLDGYNNNMAGKPLV